MIQRTVVAAFLLLAVLPSVASEPGQPADCSDFVFIEPSLACAPLWPCADGVGPGVCCQAGAPVQVESSGDLVAFHSLEVPMRPCGGYAVAYDPT